MYVVFDSETTMYNKGSRGVSDPFFDKILTIGLKYQKAKSLNYPNESFFRMSSRTHCLAQDYMPSGWLDGVDLIICHNSAFDLLFIWRNDELQSFFLRGGRIWDTQLVEYILSGQRHKYPALRDIATSTYGQSVRTKHLEGRLTQDMPIELLLEDVRNDVLDTEAVALQQVKTAKKESMMGLIMTQMDARLATIEMEFNGFMVDQEILKRNQLELEQQLTPLTREIQELALKHWPADQTFNMNSNQQLTNLLFGGSYKCKEKVEDGVFKNGNTKYKTIESTKSIQGLGVKPHKDWKIPSGGISVNEKVLKEIAKK